MRLLNVHTRQLEEFIETRSLSYAILSHTWEKNEITFRDLLEPDHRKRPTYRKIEGCCQQAICDELEYVWIDTCCIDKSSSAELSEAINSMFKWYMDSEKCYVYLADVPDGDDPFAADSAFRHSRWFTRGWTLQELIAPSDLTFYTDSWTKLFSKRFPDPNPAEKGALDLLENIAGIPRWCLENPVAYKDYSIGERISWASSRVTTREEDMAYCLLGIVQVNMPMLYGEGIKAFSRLQEEILKSSDDHSLLAWGYGMPFQEIVDIEPHQLTPVFAPFPALFKGFHRELLDEKASWSFTSHSSMTNYGLLVEIPLLPIPGNASTFLGILMESTSYHYYIVLPLSRGANRDVYYRTPGCAPFKLTSDTYRSKRPPKPTKIYIQEYPQKFIGVNKERMRIVLNYRELWNAGYIINGIFQDGFSIRQLYQCAGVLSISGLFTSGAVFLFSKPDDPHSSPFAMRIRFPKYLGEKREPDGYQYQHKNSRITFVPASSGSALEYLESGLHTISWRAGLSHPLHFLKALLHSGKQRWKHTGDAVFETSLRDDSTEHADRVTIEGDVVPKFETPFWRLHFMVKIHRRPQSEQEIVP